MKVKLLLTILGSILFINCSTEKDTTTSSLALLPGNVPVIVKINDMDTFLSEIDGNEILQQIRNSKDISPLIDMLKPLGYMKSPLGGYLGLMEEGNNSFGFVYIPVDSIPQVALDSTLNKSVESISKGDFKFIRYEVDGSAFYSSVIQNKEVVGSSEAAIESVWKHVENETPVKGQFLKFDKIGNPAKSAQIWLDLNNGRNLLNRVFGEESETGKEKYSDWLSLDVSLEKDVLLLNGLAIVNDSLPSFLGLFSNTGPLSNKTNTLAPNGLDSFISFTFTDFKNFSKNQKRFFDDTGTRDSLFTAVEEIGIGQMDTNRVLLLKAYGTANISDYIQSIQTSSMEYQGSEITELGKDSLLRQSFYPLVQDFEPNFACVMENTFVFSGTREGLERFIDSNKSGQTFDKSLLFENIKDLITEESTLLSVANSKGIEGNLNRTGLGSLSHLFKNTDLTEFLFSSQIVSDAGFLHTNYLIKKINATGTKSGTLEMFKVQLDSDIYLNPQFFTNHRTQGKDIVVQDQDNVLYLITNKGKVIWKKELESAVQGKIHEVDIYRNGKYQLAFTTNNRFYIIDRNGKEVAPFTFKYDGGNLNPLAVFDYSNNKNYRFVVTQGAKVFMYNNEGKIVSGFKYTNAEDTITGAPQHFVIGTKDYLVFKLANGLLKILDRVGNDRIKIKEKISFSENEVKVHQNKFIVTSKDGLLHEIEPTGKIGKSNLQLNADHGFDATSRTLVIMNDNILSIRGKEVTLDLGVYTKPTIFYLNDKIYISVTDIQNLKTYMFDSQAEPIAGFPIYGASAIDMTDMDNDKKPELVLKDQDNSIIVYKIQ
ncbi:ribonuclease HII [Maribacter sp. 4G9]|uniref:ribonuclease HII n=1 Tax=Maribacter sp. 4G9 TaxID=1889777 RepID=UPI000C155C8D|nr:ribonuclease HII [Maribacter sp. 4G9]PIB26727.1 hypothetical protein BFP75_00525 [Maribacter sp. 4G9]